jgi:hypothetical protein
MSTNPYNCVAEHIYSHWVHRSNSNVIPERNFVPVNQLRLQDIPEKYVGRNNINLPTLERLEYFLSSTHRRT